MRIGGFLTSSPKELMFLADFFFFLARGERVVGGKGRACKVRKKAVYRIIE